MTKRSIRSWILLALLGLFLAGLAAGGPAAAAAGTIGETAAGAPRPYYLPHMTWDEVAAYLATSDMVIIPVGSMEQHGKHLPLCSDIVEATEICLRIGQRTGVLVAPSVLAGVSEHHMAFPGTIALSPATFEAVLFETAQSLIAHGFRRIIIYTGHGGNYTSVANVVYRINRETKAMAVDAGRADFPPPDPKITGLKGDSHAGVEETSMMLFLSEGLVRMGKAENPNVTYPPAAREILAKTGGANQAALLDALLFQPLGTGKLSSTRELTNNGVVTGEDLKNSSADLGRLAVDFRVEGVVRLIEAWRKAQP